ncbi:MAG: archaeosortase/exosortase family protein [Nitrospirae bacterium]|nr:archaeosortase/exosortase family protein [Nitrospirota bacterium]
MSGLICVLLLFKPIVDLIDINGLYTNFVVFLSAKTIGGLLRIPCSYDGSIIGLPAISLDVRFGCNGLEAVIMFAIAVIVFPAPWRIKLKGILAGFVIIQFLNILRIAVLAYVGVYHKGVFDVIHMYFAQVIMIAVVLGILMVYLNYVRGHNPS